MKSIRKTLLQKGDQFILKVLSDHLTLTSKLKGSTLFVRNNKGTIEIFKNDLRNKISLLDRITVFYEKAFNHFEKVKNYMPYGYVFCVRYNSSKKVDPKYFRNGMYLERVIVKDSSGQTIDVEESKSSKWSDLLQIGENKILFEGYLDESSKNLALNKIKSKEELTDEDIKEIFKISSLPKAKFFLKSYSKAKAEHLNFKLSNEDIINDDNESDMPSIVIIDSYTFLNKMGAKKYLPNAGNYENNYISFINRFFNDLWQNNKDIRSAKLKSKKFTDSENFQLNFSCIKNSKTIEILENNKDASKLYILVFNSFKSPIKKAFGLINDSLLMDINNNIKRIHKMLRKDISEFLSFDEYKNDKIIKENSTVKGSIVLDKKSLNLDYSEKGKEKVNIICGRFQPFTKGHLKVIKDLYEKNGLPVVVFIINNPKIDNNRKPFSTETQFKMFNTLKGTYPFIKDFMFLPQASIDKIFNKLRPKYEPVLWGTGTDRMKSYGYQVNNQKYRNELNVDSSFKLSEVERDESNISASKVRDILKTDNSLKFKSYVPMCIHSMYNDFKNELSDNSSVADLIVNDSLKDAEIWNMNDYPNCRHGGHKDHNKAIKEIIKRINLKYSKNYHRLYWNDLKKLFPEKISHILTTV
jgi:cytidyltransferase-like protein